jgi:hypothetical protein
MSVFTGLCYKKKKKVLKIQQQAKYVGSSYKDSSHLFTSQKKPIKEFQSRTLGQLWD